MIEHKCDSCDPLYSEAVKFLDDVISTNFYDMMYASRRVCIPLPQVAQLMREFHEYMMQRGVEAASRPKIGNADEAIADLRKAGFDAWDHVDPADYPRPEIPAARRRGGCGRAKLMSVASPTGAGGRRGK